jgi:UDP-glucose 4-epimerase
MKTIVITGCAGLIGSHLTRHLLQNGYRVIGIDDLSGGYEDYLPNEGFTSDQFEFWPLDLADNSAEQTLEHIFIDPRKEIVACFHLAAYAAEGLSPFIRRFNYKNNVLASAAVINACINYNVKLIFTSSMAVYGNQQTPFIESMTPKPIDPYGVAKFTVEQDIKIAAEQHGLRYTIVRPHNVIGIYQNIWDKYRNVVGIFIRKVLNNEPMLIYGDGYQTRAFSDVKYCMKPFEKLISTCNGYTFNIGADRSYTLNELADIVTKVAAKYGYKATKQHVESRHEVKHAECDHSLAQDPKNLGFYDRTDLHQTVEDMFGWAMSQPVRPQKRMNYEIKKGMYEYWK